MEVLNLAKSLEVFTFAIPDRSVFIPLKEYYTIRYEGLIAKPAYPQTFTQKNN